LDNNDLNNITQSIIEQISDLLKVQTFKIETKRSDKDYPMHSMDISKKIGGAILKKYLHLHVDVKNPECLVNIEVRKNETIIYTKKILGCGGFPLGINGRVLMLISGGIDSPVAANLLMKKGFLVDFVTFISPPHTDERSLNKVKQLINQLTVNNHLMSPTLYVVTFTQLQHEIAHISNHTYQIIIMRRYFFRIAEYLLKTYDYDAIATGESLGQVASQTIQSIQTISEVLDKTIVLRPLLTYDKLEIINLAKQIGTYETSILPYPDSCSLFVPANPVTKPSIKIANKLEKELALIEPIYENLIKKNIKVEKLDIFNY